MSGFQLSPAFCSHNGVVILSNDSKDVLLGLLNENDTVLKTRIQKTFPEVKIAFTPIDKSTFDMRLSRFYSDQNDIASSDLSVALGSSNDEGKGIDEIDEEAPIINLLNSVFLEAIARRASDIHIESEKQLSRIRFRIDGVLVTVLTISQDKAVALSSRLKVLSNLNVLETRKPQDGRLNINSGEETLDIRVSITPTVYGESIVLRLLNRSDASLGLEELGFSQKDLESIHSIISCTSGLVLISGPTGSGKTTTLGAILRKLNTETTKIISIEDPVENRIDGVTQIQINEEIGITFDSMLRRVFRQDPDIIMIGEIRDSVTAELAIRAALTGHLVFATLHTTSVNEVPIRLTDMGVPPYLVAATLRALVGQRLVRRVCDECSGAGCDRCMHTGFYGRTVIAETLVITETLRSIIRDNIDEGRFLKALRASGFRDMYQDGREKVAQGITTQQEIRSELGGFNEP